MAAAAVMRLQTVVSREVAMTDSAVVTVGTLRAGMNENVIPDRALLRLNVRTFKDQVRDRVLSAIKRIVEAEAAASGAPKPPEFSVLSEYPLTRNDAAPTRKVAAAFERRFGAEAVLEPELWVFGGARPCDASIDPAELRSSDGWRHACSTGSWKISARSTTSAGRSTRAGKRGCCQRQHSLRSGAGQRRG
jgi:hypothetical protein